MPPLDRELIHALQADGRASYASLAAQVGVTEKIVRGRVNALRATGAIDITTVTDPGALGYRYVSLVGIRATGAGSLLIATRLAHLDGIDYVVVTTGRYNLLVEVFSRTLADLRELVDARIQALPGVTGVEVYPYLSLPCQGGAFATVRAKPKRKRGRCEPVAELDAIDKAIVGRLNADGRESFRTVGAALSISETQVRRRVARMQDAGALRIMAIANPRSLGFEVMAMLGVDCAPPASTVDVAEALSDLASVTCVAICAGRFNIWAEIVCATLEDMVRILDTGVRQIPGVRSVEPFVYLDLQYRRVSPASSATG